MSQHFEIYGNAAIPFWRKPEEAREELRRQVEDFVALSAHQASGKDPAPALALKVTAGTGKTAATLRAIAAHADALLKRGHVLFYAPTHALAERAAEEFRALAPGVPVDVLRGRQAPRPDRPEETMCVQATLAREIAGLVPSIAEALCRARNERGEIVAAACAKGCPYLAQRDVGRARVLFLPHAYLALRPPLDPSVPVALRIIDEKVWSSLKRTARITVEDFLRLPKAMDPKSGEEHRRAKAALLEALQAGDPPRAALRAAGFTPADLARLAKAEAAARPELPIRPWDSRETAQWKADTFNRSDFTASLKRQSIFDLLAEGETDTCNRLSFGERQTGHDRRLTLSTHKLTALPRDAPLLLLDADADPEIVARLAPGCAFAAIEARPEADILQIFDRTLSNASLLDREKGKALRDGILALIAREVGRAQGRGVLLVATKRVLRQLHADVGTPCPEGDDTALLQPLLGASPRWFGASTQGINDYEGYETVIIVGRLQPRPVDIEDIARCLFGDDPLPVLEHRDGPLPVQPAPCLRTDGSLADARMPRHPDPRAQAVLRQIRECGSSQAAARIRPIAPKSAKRMVILSNIPLPDIPVTRLLSFDAACRGLDGEPDPSGFLRLEKALTADRGGAVRGVRLSGKGLAEDLPRDFRDENSGREFRRGRPTEDMFALVRRIAARNGWPVACLELRRSGGGTPVPAVIFCAASEAISRAGMFWPDYRAKLVP